MMNAECVRFYKHAHPSRKHAHLLKDVISMRKVQDRALPLHLQCAAGLPAAMVRPRHVHAKPIVGKSKQLNADSNVEAES